MPKGVYPRRPRLLRPKPPVSCQVEGCGKAASRRKLALCEMHYMRQRRKGDFSPRVRAARSRDRAGYVILHAPTHPLAIANGTVREHRMVYYDAHGAGPFACHWCGKSVTWSDLHIDHLNDTVDDNRLSNLAATCPRCNQARGLPKMRATMRARAETLTAGDTTLPLTEWAGRLGISPTSLRWRLSNGWSEEDAVSVPRGRFGPGKKTAFAREAVQRTPRSRMTPKRRAQILAQHGGLCAMCKKLIGDASWVADHRVPLVMGGADDLSNLQPLHASPCNKIKTASDIKALAKAARIERREVEGPKPAQIKSRSDWPKGRKLTSRNTFARRGG